MRQKEICGNQSGLYAEQRLKFNHGLMSDAGLSYCYEQMWGACLLPQGALQQFMQGD